ncbi:MAG: hypothetical protein KBD21_04100 [Candidatus Pacebacteria bacterium]|nr:hypothetical protein [Candidatus Paceibacterota bacterium]
MKVYVLISDRPESEWQPCGWHTAVEGVVNAKKKAREWTVRMSKECSDKEVIFRYIKKELG